MQVDKRAVVIIVVGSLFLIGAFVFLINWKSQPVKPEEVQLEFWGVFDDSDVYKQLIKDFNEEYPHIKISYYKKQILDYEELFLDAMASGRGPDIFMVHNSWLPRYKDKMVFAPLSLISANQVRAEFVDVVYNDFVLEGQIIALPLGLDTLALFYNKDIFNNSGVPRPPETWNDFLEDVEKIVVRDAEDNIIKAGATIGTARSINRSTDILSLLMMQSGTPIVDRESKKVVFDKGVEIGGEYFYPGQYALRFYTDFANPLKSVYTWNTRMHYSLDAFEEGNVGMMFNYSYQIESLRNKVPYLDFDISYMPQIKETGNKVNYASYWGLGVPKNSEHSQEAWQFITWLSQRENYKKYLELSKRPTARRDLIEWQSSDKDLGVFAQQVLTARSWYQEDNIAIEQYFADMIESVIRGEATFEEAVKKAAERIRILN